MRELKFRAWDKITNRYYVVSTLEYADNGELCEVWLADIMVIETNDACRNPKDVILEQYTGLKDKNGKEIYEGDIIQEEIDFNSKMTDGVFTYVVEWDNDTLSYGLRGSGNSIHDELWEVNASVEIVGNIHENQD